MATLPAFFRRSEAPGKRPLGPAAVPPAHHTVREGTEQHPYRLRALPLEDVFFYSKKVDNSRLEREPDPKSRGACWSAIGAACLAVALLTGVLVPSVASVLDGYKLESLRAEERRLLDERRALELEEARLLSPQRMEQLARQQNLVTPARNQVFHLDGKPDGAVAMVK